jgi:hypothetical protein
MTYHPHTTTHLVEVENQVQLANIAKELVQHFHEEVDRLKICKLIVVRIYASAEEEPGIPAIDDLRGAAEFDEVGLMFLIAWGDKAVDLALELDLLVVVVGAVPFGQAGLASV